MLYLIALIINIAISQTWAPFHNEELFKAKIDHKLSISGKAVNVVTIDAFTLNNNNDKPPPIERPPFVK